MALLLKIILVPLLLWGLTIVGRVLGPRVAGMMAGIPMVAGPLVAFMAVEQGASFASRSATSTLAGEAALVTFCIAYALAARRRVWWQCLLVGWATFLGSTAILNQFSLTTTHCLVIGLLAPLVLRFSLVNPSADAQPADRTSFSSDLLWRMLAGAALVLLITALARGLGPRLSGLLTIFPVATAILAAFSHRSHGALFSVELMRGIAFGMYSFSAFFLVVALGIETLGLFATFAWALVASLAVQAVLVGIILLKRQRLRREDA